MTGPGTGSLDAGSGRARGLGPFGSRVTFVG